MARVFMSFLGTNDYVPCNYYIDRPEPMKIENVRFVQEAIASFYCREWTPDDRILIFTTMDSERLNWLDDGHEDRATKAKIPSEGLFKRLSKLKLKAGVHAVKIKEGLSEADIWEVFQTVYESMNDEDEVIFDITHAFRSIPMLAIVILNYAKVLKNINITGIHYGPFETLGKVEDVKKKDVTERDVPILDLSAFDSLLDWSFGVERFVTSGDANRLSQLMKSHIKPVLADSKGHNPFAKNLDKIGKGLNKFSNIIATCRACDISTQVQFNKKHIAQYQDSDLLPAFKPLIEKIDQGFVSFNGDPVNDGIEASKWCLKHNFIQQGLTLLLETMISHIVIKAEGAYLNQKDRETAARLAQGVFKELRREPSRSGDPVEPSMEFVSNVTGYLRANTNFTLNIGNLGPIRNDINHGGYREGANKPENFSLFLSEYISKFEEFLKSA